MATKSIGFAEQRTGDVRVCDEKGNTLFTKSGELIDYSSSTVTIQQASTVYVMDANGRTISAKSAK